MWIEVAVGGLRVNWVAELAKRMQKENQEKQVVRC
tara:strand:+ start:628 stop:732 length:105 start_codon:yes stop_codon:yes gene_type:complete